eukprot:TRINITY_DN50582_c0_g1_i1.p1 TRINITY_DN50582_c0_g1~~TRINITY_DN50582_c0_g1_i1.p1  ORF type:complete len:329 (+),score=45.21 TRINITY_DN50582_c0_g1_i1:73-987(+)
MGLTRSGAEEGITGMLGRMGEGVMEENDESSGSWFEEGWSPEMTLEESLLAMEKPDGYPDGGFKLGSADFPTVKSFMTVSRLFIQDCIADGCQVPAPFAMALHLYTLETYIYRECNWAMRCNVTDRIEKWRTFIWYLHTALQQLSSRRCTVFRGIQGLDPKTGVVDMYHAGRLVTWAAFSSTSRSRKVASFFLEKVVGKPKPTEPKGMIFKIHAKTVRDIKRFSYFPFEEELLYGPNTVFRVKDIYHPTDFNMRYGVPDDADERWSPEGVDCVNVSPVPIHEAHKLNILLVEMEELDDSEVDRQ